MDPLGIPIKLDPSLPPGTALLAYSPEIVPGSMRWKFKDGVVVIKNLEVDSEEGTD